MLKHIIYLAAGSSRRFGENKLLRRMRGGCEMYRYGLEMLYHTACVREDTTLTVVTRYSAIWLETRIMPDLRTVMCHESEKGLSYTIRAGLDALGPLPPEDFVVFAVADQPFLSNTTVHNLLDAAAPGVEAAAATCGKRRGNPVMFSAALVPELYALTGDQGGREVLRRHSYVSVPVLSGRELCDIDTPEAMKLLR